MDVDLSTFLPMYSDTTEHEEVEVIPERIEYTTLDSFQVFVLTREIAKKRAAL